MFQEKKFFLIIVGVLIMGTIIAIYFVQHSRPQNVIENKLKIELPSSAIITNYTYYKDGGYFNAKILFETQNISTLKDQLNSHLGGISKQKHPEHINFKNTCGWWDLEKQNIVESYNTFVSGEKKCLGHPQSLMRYGFLLVKIKKGNTTYIFHTKNRSKLYYLLSRRLSLGDRLSFTQLAQAIKYMLDGVINS